MSITAWILTWLVFSAIFTVAESVQDIRKIRSFAGRFGYFSGALTFNLLFFGTIMASVYFLALNWGLQ